MNQYKRIGIDTSKAVFTLHGIDQQDRPVLRINLRRAQLISFFAKLPPTGHHRAQSQCGEPAPGHDPGVGPVTALTLAIEIDPAAFELGRHLAAWAGLTPTEHSTGGKQRMGGISRAGNERLRVLLVTGATSVINAAKKPGSKLMTEWLRALLLRKPRKVVAVALANKMARVAWAMMTRGEVYRHAATATGAALA